MDLTGKRVLIIKPSSLGDVVHTLPVAHAIKRHYPSCYLGWVVQDPLRAVIDNDPSIDEVIPISIPSTSDPNAGKGAFLKAFKATLTTIWELRREFRSNPYDVVLDLHASFRSGLLSLANPDGLRVGFADAKELNTWFQHKTITPDPARPHAVDRNTMFADFLSCPTQPQDYRIVTSPEARAKVEAFLKVVGVLEQDRIVYANPAARWASKFWTVEAWAELADQLIAREGVQVVFGGSAQDLPYINEIAVRMNKRGLTGAGILTLAEAIALIQRADVYVGVDSGPMHIAAFAGTPVVALFGPTEPEKVGPHGEGHCIITREDLDCLGCRKRQCSDRQCLEDLTPKSVFEAVMKLLERKI